MLSILLNISFVFTLVIILLILILVGIKAVNILWRANKKHAQAWIAPLLENYIANADAPVPAALQSRGWPLSTIVQYSVIYRSFGKKGKELGRIAQAYEALGFIDADLKRLKSPFWWVRAEGARCLGQMKSHRTKPALLEGLNDPVKEVRMICAWSLGRSGETDVILPIMETLVKVSGLAGMRLSSTVFELGKKAIDPLVQILDNKDPAVRTLAIHLLAEVGGHSTAKHITRKTAKDEHKEVRIAAYKALGTLEEPSAETVFSEGLKDDAWEVRAQSARGLGMIGSDISSGLLKKALEDTNWWVRRNAGEALTKLGQKGKKMLVLVQKTGASAEARNAAAQWMDTLEQLG
ncbi:MAG: hypothetical protein A2297_10395 [Elusimicrobia bacterium RIFOXYB2_FULL_48_7]|nr:MAG: hypothetical protein A2297_10395 [Elusimicrobia bacterium RIFOXYB2_FULL_48_7]